MVKVIWCWRCQMDVPMLERGEFEAMEREIEARSIEGPPQKDPELNIVCEVYNRITGFDETNAAAIYHHLTWQHSRPCQACGKPLRTSRAKWCAACGVSNE